MEWIKTNYSSTLEEYYKRFEDKFFIYVSYDNSDFDARNWKWSVTDNKGNCSSEGETDSKELSMYLAEKTVEWLNDHQSGVA